MSLIDEAWQRVHQRIAAACLACGREPSAVRLLAVSKTQTPDAVAQAARCGQRVFGENHVQEGIEKMLQVRQWQAAGLLGNVPTRWHLIGPLQSNKTRVVAEHFDWVQSIDRLKLAERLSAQRPEALAPLQVCIQVNIDASPTKAGVAPADALALAGSVAALPRLRLRGIMVIPDPVPDPRAQAQVFARAHELWLQLRQAGLPIDTLSMGMSADLEVAIAQGSTMVRVGSALFGERGVSAAV